MRWDVIAVLAFLALTVAVVMHWQSIRMAPIASHVVKDIP